MYIREIFEPETAFDIEWLNDYAPDIQSQAIAYDRQGRIIDITFTVWGKGMVDIEFNRNKKIGITGEGDANRMLATVIEAIRVYTTQMYAAPYLLFSSSEPSRTRAYTAIVRRLATQFGYTPIDKKDLPPGTWSGELDDVIRGATHTFILQRTTLQSKEAGSVQARPTSPKRNV